MSLGRKGWLVGFAVLGVLGAACGGEELAGRGDDEDEADGGSNTSGNNGSSGNDNGSSGSENNGSSGNGSSGNGSSGEPDGGPITGPTVTLTGTALAPNGVTPLGQVTVSWSRTAPAALPVGPFCASCTAPPAGTAATSAADGSFQLTIPANEDVYLVTQMGNFRRVRTARFATTDIAMAQTLTTLPGRQELAVGDTVPSIGILPGNYDEIADALDELGVKGITPLTVNDLGNPVELQRYQIVLVPGSGVCDTPRAFEPTVQNALRQYVSLGGALYVSDFSYEYFNRAFPGFVQFAGNGQAGQGCLTASVVTGRYDDVSLATWLSAPASGSELGTVYTRIDGTITQPGPGRDGVTTNLTPKTWATVTSTATPTPAIVSLPYGCGQAFVSTVTAGGSAGVPTPASLQRGRALAYTLFRGHDGCLASPAPSCVGTPGAQCTPGTPAVQGAACGYCGTSVQRCSNECKLLASACQEEQPAADRCLPGSSRTTGFGCPVGSIRSQSCQGGVSPDAARCTWAAPAGACTAVNIPFFGVSTLGTTTSRVVTAAEQQMQVSVGGVQNVCPSADLRSRVGALTEIRNDSGVAIKVDITVTPKRTTGGAVDRTLAIYTVAPPLDDASTSSCTQRNDDCTAPSTVESCVSGVDIPAGGKIWAQVSNYTEAALAGEFSLNAKRIQ